MVRDEQRRQRLADFLRTRRLRLLPEQVGLAHGDRRPTPGLRREEAALFCASPAFLISNYGPVKIPHLTAQSTSR